jgi:hypothetical protein
MHNPFARCHPLDISRPDLATVSLEIFVDNFTLLHVSDCLEATMGMVWEPSRQLYVKGIKHQERV